MRKEECNESVRSSVRAGNLQKQANKQAFWARQGFTMWLAGLSCFLRFRFEELHQLGRHVRRTSVIVAQAAI